MEKHSSLIFLVVISLFFPLAVQKCLAQDSGAPAVDLVVVLDCSKSMKTDVPEALVKKTFQGILDSLSGGSRIAVVTFSDSAKLALPFTPISEKRSVEEAAWSSLKTAQAVTATNGITVTVRPGDTLWKLAQRYYGNPFLWTRIMDANQIHDARKTLLTGSVIRIPDVNSGESISGNIQKKEYTDIPAGIERAVYELEQNGRKDAERVVVLLSDGIIHLEDSPKAVEKYRWLKDELVRESRKADTSIFSIVFTEQADFELVQTLALETSGGYSRVLKEDDVSGCISNMNGVILKNKVEPKPPQPVVQPAQEPMPRKRKWTPNPTLAGGVAAGLIVMGALGSVLVTRRKRSGKAKHPGVPDACLIDLSNVTDNKTFLLDKPVMTIGRAENSSADIPINRSTVSAAHAHVEYKNNGFYLVDLGSTNGTYVNSRKDRITGEVLLKSGDIIAFDQYEFKFLVRGQVVHNKTEISHAKREFSIPEQVEAGKTQISESKRAGTIISMRRDDEEEQDLEIPEAYLLDTSGITDDRIHKITRRIVRIGRVKRDDIDICIDKNTVSAVHAQIEFRDGAFYLSDLGSRNGTYLNDERERITSEIRLNNSDIVYFDQYRFKFVVC